MEMRPANITSVATNPSDLSSLQPGQSVQVKATIENTFTNSYDYRMKIEIKDSHGNKVFGGATPFTRLSCCQSHEFAYTIQAPGQPGDYKLYVISQLYYDGDVVDEDSKVLDMRVLEPPSSNAKISINWPSELPVNAGSTATVDIPFTVIDAQPNRQMKLEVELVQTRTCFNPTNPNYNEPHTKTVLTQSVEFTTDRNGSYSGAITLNLPADIAVLFATHTLKARLYEYLNGEPSFLIGPLSKSVTVKLRGHLGDVLKKLASDFIYSHNVLNFTFITLPPKAIGDLLGQLAYYINASDLCPDNPSYCYIYSTTAPEEGLTYTYIGESPSETDGQFLNDTAEFWNSLVKNGKLVIVLTVGQDRVELYSGNYGQYRIELPAKWIELPPKRATFDEDVSEDGGNVTITTTVYMPPNASFRLVMVENGTEVCSTEGTADENGRATATLNCQLSPGTHSVELRLQYDTEQDIYRVPEPPDDIEPRPKDPMPEPIDPIKDDPHIPDPNPPKDIY